MSGNLTTINGSIDTVILATSKTYPDALAAAPGASNIGAPVLLTEGNSLSDSTSQTLDDANVSNAVLVGGPEVISEDVEDSLEEHVSLTTRIWELTQVGTSTDIATYFWDSSEEATVVQYDALEQNEDGYHLLAAAKEKAMAENEPLLISGEGNLSNRTVRAMEELEVEEAEVYTTSSSNVDQNLENINLEVNQGDTEELVESLHSDLETEIDSEVNIVVASNYTHVIGRNSINPSIYLFSGTDVAERLQLIEDSSVEEITLTGDPSRLPEVQENIESINPDIEITTVEGKTVYLSNEIFRKDFGTRAEQQEKSLEDWSNNLDTNELETQLEDARDNIDRIDNSAELDQIFDDAESALEKNNLFGASLLINKAQSEIDKLNFRQLSAEEILTIVREELGNINKSVNISVNTSANISDNISSNTSAENLSDRLDQNGRIDPNRSFDVS